MKLLSYEKIERQVEAYGNQLQLGCLSPSPEERAAWAAHSERSGYGYREFTSKCELARRGSSDRHRLGSCTCATIPGFPAWVVEMDELHRAAQSLTFQRLAAVRDGMEALRRDLKAKNEAVRKYLRSR